MSDTPQPATPSPAAPAGTSDSRMMAIICYGLYIATFTNGLTGIAGVVLAYVKRGEARGTIWESHFTNLIHVFWAGVVLFALFLLAVIFGAISISHAAHTDGIPGAVFLLPVLWLCCMGYVVWYLYRTIKGLMYAIDSKAYS